MNKFFLIMSAVFVAALFSLTNSVFAHPEHSDSDDNHADAEEAPDKENPKQPDEKVQDPDVLFKNGMTLLVDKEKWSESLK
ncbi:MAG: hypothetical protein ABIH42_06545 [Planctomycetota bacterium]